MVKVNVFEIKAKFSEYLKRAEAGEHILICRHNTPIAEITRVSEARTSARAIGPLPGAQSFDVAEAFFEPLSEAELALWEQPAVHPASASRRHQRAARPAAAPKTTRAPRRAATPSARRPRKRT